MVLPGTCSNDENSRVMELFRQTISRSTLSFIVLIWLESSLFSFVVTLAAMTGRVTPQARPSAALDSTKMYGTFCHRIRF